MTVMILACAGRSDKSVSLWEQAEVLPRNQIGARPHAVVRKPNQQIRRPKEKFTPQLIHGSIHPRPSRVLPAGRYSQPTHPS